MLQRRSRHHHLKTGDSRGQVLAEFALVLLAFMTIFMGIVEFGVAFSVKMQVSFASRDAVVVASESGITPQTADGAILNRIDQDLMAPASRSHIVKVEIFWANADGSPNGGAIERYTPGGPLFLGWGGWTNTLDAYPASSRCAYIGGSAAGCQASPNHSGPDRIGVTIVYSYGWTTPLPNLIGLAGSGFTFTQTNLTTMEPIPGT